MGDWLLLHTKIVKNLFQTFEMLWCGVGAFRKELDKRRRHRQVSWLVLEQGCQVGAWWALFWYQVQVSLNHHQSKTRSDWMVDYQGWRKAGRHRCHHGRWSPSWPWARRRGTWASLAPAPCLPCPAREAPSGGCWPRSWCGWAQLPWDGQLFLLIIWNGREMEVATGYPHRGSYDYDCDDDYEYEMDGLDLDSG